MQWPLLFTWQICSQVLVAWIMCRLRQDLLRARPFRHPHCSHSVDCPVPRQDPVPKWTKGFHIPRHTFLSLPFFECRISIAMIGGTVPPRSTSIPSTSGIGVCGVGVHATVFTASSTFRVGVFIYLGVFDKAGCGDRQQQQQRRPLRLTAARPYTRKTRGQDTTALLWLCRRV